jgi:hypothetical protein
MSQCRVAQSGPIDLVSHKAFDTRGTVGVYNGSGATEQQFSFGMAKHDGWLRR